MLDRDGERDGRGDGKGKGGGYLGVFEDAVAGEPFPDEGAVARRPVGVEVVFGHVGVAVAEDGEWQETVGGRGGGHGWGWLFLALGCLCGGRSLCGFRMGAKVGWERKGG